MGREREIKKKHLPGRLCWKLEWPRVSRPALRARVGCQTEVVSVYFAVVVAERELYKARINLHTCVILFSPY